MRLTTFILLSTCLAASAKGLTQSVTIAKRNAPMQEVFKDIEKQTGYQFFYKEKVLDNTKPVTINVKSASLEQVLQTCFKDQPVTYNVINKIIVVTVKPTVDLQSTDISNLRNEPPPPIDITGKVTDADGNPLVGASVKVKGSDKGTTTNTDGVFVLKGVDENAVLEISYVGYETYTVAVGNKSSIVASLKLKPESLNEVIVNKGYYTEKQRLSTGNITTVTAKEIEKQPINNPLQALAGRVPGMLIIQQSGIPGGEYAVQVRGLNSVANGNEPLYIVDGVPISSKMMSSATGFNIIQGGSPLNYLNPRDIENISVLKDADATAIYGSRGANGVILITTKKSHAGKMKFDLSVQHGVGEVSRKPNLLTGSDYLLVRREAFQMDGKTIGSTDYDINGVWDTTKFMSWPELIYGKQSKYSDIQSSLSGGGANFSYLISGNYHRETLVFPGDFADQKAAIHLNFSSDSYNKKFKLQFSASYLNDINRLTAGDLSNFVTLAPNKIAIYNNDGSLNWENNTWDNPFAALQRKYESRGSNLVSNLVLKYKILKNLEIQSSFGFTNLTTNENDATPSTYFNPALGNDIRIASFTNNEMKSWIIEPTISYERPYNKTVFNFLVGSTLQKNFGDGQTLNANGYNSDLLLGSITGAGNIFGGDNGSFQYKYNSVFGRFNLNQDSKYLFNLIVRRDGSSRFGTERKLTNFGALGIAWLFSNEDFIQKSFPFLSFGKIRVSYGTTGNDQIGDYRYLNLYNSTSQPYQGSQGLVPSNLLNPYFEWESNRKVELALDLSFLKDRISFGASVYRNRSSNQLMEYTLPAITGFTSILKNLNATVENSGVELTLNTINLKSSKLSWSTSLNLTKSRNKLIEFPNLEESSYASSFSIGHPISVAKVFHLIGVDSQTGLYQFTDKNGNITQNPSYNDDRTTLISTMPKYFGGLQNTFGINRFQLDFLFQFVNQKAISPLFQSTLAPGMINYNVSEQILNRWKKPGDVSKYQQLTQDFGSAAYAAYTYAQSSDFAWSDASFIRLRNASVSYRFTENVERKLKVQQLRFFIQAQNFLTITNFIGADPEVTGVTSLPPLKVLVGGIQLTF